MAVTIVKTFFCSDGTRFDNESKANQHESKLEDNVYASAFGLTPKAANWLRTSYSGKKLAEAYSMSEYGIWKITGEDPNCDLGGSHYTPDLGTVEGKLSDVVEHAVVLHDFFTWGGGGNITKTTVQKIKKV